MSDWVPSENNPNDLSLTTMEEMLSDVLQEQAFMFSENRGDGEIAPPDPPYHYARIEFDGPCSGRLGLIFPQSLVSELIANMLGMEVEDIEKEDISDALKELLNVVCGKFLVAAFGPRLKFDLSIPTVTEIDLAQWEQHKSERDTTTLLVEDEPVLFKLGL